MPTHRTIRRHPLIHRRRRQIITSQISRITNRIRRTPKLPSGRIRPPRCPRTSNSFRANSGNQATAHPSTTAVPAAPTLRPGLRRRLRRRPPRLRNEIIHRRVNRTFFRVRVGIELSQDLVSFGLSLLIALRLKGRNIRPPRHLHGACLRSHIRIRNCHRLIRMTKILELGLNQFGAQVSRLNHLFRHLFTHHQIMALCGAHLLHVRINVIDVGRQPSVRTLLGL